MKTHRSVLHASFTFLALATGGISAVAMAQDVARPAKPATAGGRRAARELQVLSALRAHPLTAGYPITATWSKGAVVLSGGVGTKQVHDVAVRLAIASGVADSRRPGDRHGAGARRGDRRGCRGHRRCRGLRRLGASSPYIYPPPLDGQAG